MAREIPLTQGKFAIVDDDVYEWASNLKWHAACDNNTFYAKRHFGKWPHQKVMLLHREIMNAPEDMLVDHISGDGLDCRRENMRLVTKAENQRNRRLQRNNTSGYKGVHWDKARKKWQAQIAVNGRSIYLGYFSTAEKAAIAYDEAARIHHGEFARTNF